jgi:HSP20 family protein
MKMANLPTLFDRSSNRDPMKDIRSLQHKVERLFNDMWNPDRIDTDIASMNAQSFSPSCDVEEGDNHYLLAFDLPGLKKEDIRVDVKDGVLTVSGERKEERVNKAQGRYRSERFHGTYERSFNLPTQVNPEDIEASYDAGVLRVVIPKVETSQSRQIKIGDGKPRALERPSSSQSGATAERKH